MKNIHWHILGAGAIGCLLASELQTAGYRVTLLLRNAHALSLFQQQGLHLLVDDEKKFIAAEAAVAADYHAPIDYLFITTKAHDVLTALNSVKACLHPQTQIVFCHNGLGVYEEIIKKFPTINACLAMTTQAALLVAPFVVKHIGQGELWLGQNLQALAGVAMPVKFFANIVTKQWEKLAINCCINPLTAIYRCQNGALLESILLKDLMAKLCHEIGLVIRALNIQLDTDTLLETVFYIAKLTANNYSSMFRDVEQNRITEIAYLNGYVVHQAKRLGLFLPYNEAVTRILQRNYAIYNL